MAESTEPTRVLHLITRYIGGGAEKTLDDILDALRESEDPFDLHVGFGPEHDDEAVTEFERRGVESVEFTHLKHYKPISLVLATGQVAHYLRRGEIEVLHTHSTEAGIVGRVAAAITGTPVIHHIHGDPITADRSRMLNILLFVLERIAGRFTDEFVAVSEELRDTYLERGIGTEEQYTVIYPGVDTAQFGTATPTDSFAESDTITVLYVGRLAEGKGLFDLLSALERLQDTAAITVSIAGNGQLRSELEDEVADRELGETVDFLGHRDDVPALMAGADVLVLPSYREGLPRVISEAMAAGLPVISTTVSGIPEQVDDGRTGFLIDPGDVDELLRKLQRIIESAELREEMGDNAKMQSSKFDIDDSKQSYRELYREFLGKETGTERNDPLR